MPLPKLLTNLAKPFANITLRATKYPVTRHGTGSIPIFCVGMGTLMLRTMSPNFYEHFTVYAADSYWIGKQRLSDPSQLTMQDFVDDVTSATQQLSLHRPILLGHSCFGILALEIAKQRNANTRGVIANATPTGWNATTQKITAKLFEENASPERKHNHQLRLQHFEKVKKPVESEVSLNSYERDTAKYWSQFSEVTRSYLETLWADVEADDAISDHFWGHVLPEHNTELKLNSIDVPVIVLGGNHDYDSAPLTLWKSVPASILPKQFSLINCGDTGHWPNLESREIFDAAIINWIKDNKLNLPVDNQTSAKDDSANTINSHFFQADL